MGSLSPVDFSSDMGSYCLTFSSDMGSYCLTVVVYNSGSLPCSACIIHANYILGRIQQDKSIPGALNQDMPMQVDILCNDCNQSNRVRWHILGLCCPDCLSYNTRRIMPLGRASMGSLDSADTNAVEWPSPNPQEAPLPPPTQSPDQSTNPSPSR